MVNPEHPISATRYGQVPDTGPEHIYSVREVRFITLRNISYELLSLRRPGHTGTQHVISSEITPVL